MPYPLDVSVSELTVDAKEMIRAIADGGKDLTPVEEGQLMQAGWMESTGKVRLTALGRRLHSEIMESGDGPEALKDLLSF